MIEQINLSELFIKTHTEVYAKYKNYKNNCKPRKYQVQQKYLTLLNFVSKECYWSKFNFDIGKDKYIDGEISGKYLNEMHLILVKYNFYDILYKKLIDIYITTTNHETIDTVSQDSMFSRNINMTGCKRNPQYYNKPGLKIHAIVDNLRTPIAIGISESTDHDSHFISELMDKKFVDDNIFYDKCHTFLADSAYNTDMNTVNLTGKGLDVVFGRNKQHIKKGTIIQNATSEDRNIYKKRGISENFFANLERYPCIINIYEKKRESYRGLVVFVLCIMLAKKINRIIVEKNNVSIKHERNAETIRKRKDAVKRMNLKKQTCIKREESKQKQNELRKELEKKINEKINNIIKKNVCNKILKKSYNKHKTIYIKNKINKNVKNALSYDKYEKKAIDDTTAFVRNNVLSSTKTFTFATKKAYITTTEKFAFNEDNIKTKIYNQINRIMNRVNEFTRIFFNEVLMN